MVSERTAGNRALTFRAALLVSTKLPSFSLFHESFVWHNFKAAVGQTTNAAVPNSFKGQRIFSVESPEVFLDLQQDLAVTSLPPPSQKDIFVAGFQILRGGWFS